jgi:Ca-activated chloride channel homolog
MSPFNMNNRKPMKNASYPKSLLAELRLFAHPIRHSTAPNAGKRNGASIVLIAIMMMTFLILAGMTIDFAYMTLLKKELQIATDVAAKAGAIALADFHNETHAKNAAVFAARRQGVGGKAFAIRPADVQVGRIALQSDGSWDFIPNGRPYNAVRVNSKTGGKAAHKAIPLFFGGVTGMRHFEPKTYAVAGQTSVAVSICLDRSGSMCFDLTGKEWSYPENNPLYIPHNRGERYSNETSPPHPTESRWASLREGINVFLESAEKVHPQPRIGLVTWASDFEFKNFNPVIRFTRVHYNYPIKPIATADYAIDRQAIQRILDRYSANRMGGATNVSAGIWQSLIDLSKPAVGLFSQKVIILFTDGEWNEGDNPIDWAKRAVGEAVTIHTITMLAGENRDMKEVAAITGGKHYNVKNKEELAAAFRDIASTFHTAITE